MSRFRCSDMTKHDQIVRNSYSSGVWRIITSSLKSKEANTVTTEWIVVTSGGTTGDILDKKAGSPEQVSVVWCN